MIPSGALLTYVEPNGLAFVYSAVDDANLTINGVEAQKTSEAGVYSANITTAFPTAYTLVTVSHDEWKTTQTAFSPTP